MVDLLHRPLDELMAEARAVRRDARGTLVTYSPKVFVPLTKLCRDVCHYCTFAHPPRRGERAYMTLDEVLGVARAGAAAGCREALFTLGDKPELRYRAARDELAALGCSTTIEYLERAARAVLDETGLLPHLNPGVLEAADYERLAPSPPRWGPCSRPPRSASRGAEARTSARPTSSPRRGSQRSVGPARRACRSPPAC